MQLRKDFDQDLYNEHNSSGCQKGARLLSLMGFTNVVIKEEDFTYDLDALDPDGNPVKIEIEKRASEKHFDTNWRSGYKEGLNIPQKRKITNGEVDLFISTHPKLWRFILVDKRALNESVARGSQPSPNKYSRTEEFFQVPYSDVTKIEIIDNKVVYQPIRPF